MYMQETNVTRTVSSQKVGDTAVHQEQVTTGETVDKQEFGIAKTAQIIWFITSVIAIILALRFIFLILGANLTGVVLFIYNISSVLVLPFVGIFPAARTGESYFDPAALLGIALYYLLGYLLIQAISLLSKRTE